MYKIYLDKITPITPKLSPSHWKYLTKETKRKTSANISVAKV